MSSPSSIDRDHGVVSATSAAVLASGRWSGRGRPEDFASFLRTQDKVDALCEKYGVPNEFAAMMKTMLAEKAAAQASASAKKANAEPPLCGKKRSMEEANDMLLNTAIPNGVCSPPPGFGRKPQHFPNWPDRDVTDWVATREQEKAKADLAGAGAELAKANAGIAAAEAEVVNAKAELTAAKQAADAEQENLSFELAMEVANAKAKLAVAKRALAEELQRAKTAAVRQLLCCEDHVRRRAEHAMERYRRWRTIRAPAGPAA